ncbi:MAG: hypothetical protein V2I43_20130 [Parvularcula sp.]|jgi:hypothetical protein|nr:hypothetical protein [Parvularcula sp.]
MVVGDAQAWADRFVTFDDRFLERIVAVWPTCVALLPGQPHEDTITINLVDLLWKDAKVRRLCHWIEYQYEPFGLASDGSKFSKGKIDIGVLFTWDRDLYLAYECKRLNVTGKGGRSSLATAYVTEGMMRFLTEQYAEGLRVGGMLGYVMDGDMPFAQSCVNAAILAHPPLQFLAGPDPLPPVGGVERFSTLHDRAPSENIGLRHALLSR